MTAISMVRLEKVLTLSKNAVPSASLNEINLAGVYSFGRGLFKRGPLSPTETTYKSYNRLVVDEFVISQPKAWEGAIARVTEEFSGWYLSPVFPTFCLDKQRLDPRYLEWFCKREPVWVELQRKSRGIGARRESVSPDQFLSVEIPLPPLPEQRRIVARIESLAERIDEAHGLRSESHDEAESFSRSMVDAVLQDLARKYGLNSLAEFCLSITDGDHLTPAFDVDGVRFIFVGNVSSGHLHFQGCKYVTLDYFNSLRPQRVPKRGDILYSAVGATLGVPAIVDTDEPFCFQRHVAILKPNPAMLLPRFAWHILQSWTVFNCAWESATGSAQPTIPLRAIRSLAIPAVPLLEQRRIVAYLDGLQAKVDALKKLQAETAAELAALLPSILDKAFKGEL